MLGGEKVNFVEKVPTTISFENTEQGWLKHSKNKSSLPEQSFIEKSTVSK